MRHGVLSLQQRCAQVFWFLVVKTVPWNGGAVAVDKASLGSSPYVDMGLCNSSATNHVARRLSRVEVDSMLQGRRLKAGEPFRVPWWSSNGATSQQPMASTTTPSATEAQVATTPLWQAGIGVATHSTWTTSPKVTTAASWKGAGSMWHSSTSSMGVLDKEHHNEGVQSTTPPTRPSATASHPTTTDRMAEISNDEFGSCNLTAAEYMSLDICSQSNREYWQLRGGIPPDPSGCHADPGTQEIVCATGFNCSRGHPMCYLHEERYDSLQYDCGQCPDTQQLSCCRECEELIDMAATGDLKIGGQQIENVTCDGCNASRLESIAEQNQDVCELNLKTGTFMCKYAQNCRTLNATHLRKDISWDCMATPCGECLDPPARAQCCAACLAVACDSSNLEKLGFHHRRVCLGCESPAEDEAKYDLHPKYTGDNHSTSFNRYEGDIAPLSSSKNVDKEVCQSAIKVPVGGSSTVEVSQDSSDLLDAGTVPVQAGGEAPKLCNLTLSDYIASPLCKEEVLRAWVALSDLPIEEDACEIDSITGSVQCSTWRSCSGGQSMCSFYEEKHDSIVYNCKECADTLRLSCCQECFKQIDLAEQGKLAIGSDLYEHVFCDGCSSEEMQAVSLIHKDVCKVDHDTGKVECTYLEQCKAGAVRHFPEDKSWQCLITPCDQCSDITARAQCCAQCLNATCRTGSSSIHERHVCVGCGEAPQPGKPSTSVPWISVSPPRLPDHANLNASDAVEMSKCKAPNKVWQVDEVFEHVLVDAQQAFGAKVPEDSAVTWMRSCNVTTSDYANSSICENSTIEAWAKYVNITRDENACEVNQDTGAIECETTRTCGGGSTMCLLSETRHDTMVYNCSECSELQQISCCNECLSNAKKAAKGMLELKGDTFEAVNCTGCEQATLRAITRRHQDICEVDVTTGRFKCAHKEKCEVGTHVQHREDTSWQCLITPCDVCPDRTLRAQCCIECLRHACNHGEVDFHQRHICTGCHNPDGVMHGMSTQSTTTTLTVAGISVGAVASISTPSTTTLTIASLSTGMSGLSTPSTTTITIAGVSVGAGAVHGNSSRSTTTRTVAGSSAGTGAMHGNSKRSTTTWTVAGSSVGRGARNTTSIGSTTKSIVAGSGVRSGARKSTSRRSTTAAAAGSGVGGGPANGTSTHTTTRSPNATSVSGLLQRDRGFPTESASKRLGKSGVSMHMPLVVGLALAFMLLPASVCLGRRCRLARHHPQDWQQVPQEDSEVLDDELRAAAQRERQLLPDCPRQLGSRDQHKYSLLHDSAASAC